MLYSYYWESRPEVVVLLQIRHLLVMKDTDLRFFLNSSAFSIRPGSILLRIRQLLIIRNAFIHSFFFGIRPFWKIGNDRLIKCSYIIKSEVITSKAQNCMLQKVTYLETLAHHVIYFKKKQIQGKEAMRTVALKITTIVLKIFRFFRTINNSITLTICYLLE